MQKKITLYNFETFRSRDHGSGMRRDHGNVSDWQILASDFKWFGQRVPKWLQSEVGPKKAAILLTHPVHLSVGCQNLPIGNVPVITSHAVPVITGTLPWSRERNVTKLYKVNFFCIIRQIFQPNNMVIWNYMGCSVKCCFIMNFVTLLA